MGGRRAHVIWRSWSILKKLGILLEVRIEWLKFPKIYTKLLSNIWGSLNIIRAFLFQNVLSFMFHKLHQCIPVEGIVFRPYYYKLFFPRSHSINIKDLNFDFFWKDMILTSKRIEKNPNMVKIRFLFFSFDDKASFNGAYSSVNYD